MNNIEQHVATEGSGRLESVKQRFTEWRQSVQSGKRRIPEELWQAAVALGRFYSVSRIAKELGLDYGKLKRYLSASATSEQTSVQPVSTDTCSTTAAKRFLLQKTPARQPTAAQPLACRPTSAVSLRAEAPAFGEFIEVSLPQPRSSPQPTAELHLSDGRVLKLYSGRPEDLLKAALWQ